MVKLPSFREMLKKKNQLFSFKKNIWDDSSCSESDNSDSVRKATKKAPAKKPATKRATSKKPATNKAPTKKAPTKKTKVDESDAAVDSRKEDGSEQSEAPVVNKRRRSHARLINPNAENKIDEIIRDPSILNEDYFLKGYKLDLPRANSEVKKNKEMYDQYRKNNLKSFYRFMFMGRSHFKPDGTPYIQRKTPFNEDRFKSRLSTADIVGDRFAKEWVESSPQQRLMGMKMGESSTTGEHSAKVKWIFPSEKMANLYSFYLDNMSEDEVGMIFIKQVYWNSNRARRSLGLYDNVLTPMEEALARLKRRYVRDLDNHKAKYDANSRGYRKIYDIGLFWKAVNKAKSVSEELNEKVTKQHLTLTDDEKFRKKKADALCGYTNDGKNLFRIHKDDLPIASNNIEEYKRLLKMGRQFAELYGIDKEFEREMQRKKKRFPTLSEYITDSKNLNKVASEIQDRTRGVPSKEENVDRRHKVSSGVRGDSHQIEQSDILSNINQVSRNLKKWFDEKNIEPVLTQSNNHVPMVDFDPDRYTIPIVDRIVDPTNSAEPRRRMNMSPGPYVRVFDSESGYNYYTLDKFLMGISDESHARAIMKLGIKDNKWNMNPIEVLGLDEKVLRQMTPDAQARILNRAFNKFKKDNDALVKTFRETYEYKIEDQLRSLSLPPMKNPHKGIEVGKNLYKITSNTDEETGETTYGFKRVSSHNVKLEREWDKYYTQHKGEGSDSQIWSKFLSEKHPDIVDPTSPTFFTNTSIDDINEEGRSLRNALDELGRDRNDDARIIAKIIQNAYENGISFDQIKNLLGDVGPIYMFSFGERTPEQIMLNHKWNADEDLLNRMREEDGISENVINFIKNESKNNEYIDKKNEKLYLDYLKEHKFVNKDGFLIDPEGYLLNNEGHRINSGEGFVRADKGGYKVDDEGHLLRNDGTYVLKNDDPRIYSLKKVDPRGNISRYLVDSLGNPIEDEEPYLITVDNGYFVNNMGILVDRKGFPIGGKGAQYRLMKKRMSDGSLELVMNKGYPLLKNKDNSTIILTPENKKKYLTDTRGNPVNYNEYGFITDDSGQEIEISDEGINKNGEILHEGDESFKPARPPAPETLNYGGFGALPQHHGDMNSPNSPEQADVAVDWHRGHFMNRLFSLVEATEANSDLKLKADILTDAIERCKDKSTDDEALKRLEFVSDKLGNYYRYLNERIYGNTPSDKHELKVWGKQSGEDVSDYLDPQSDKYKFAERGHMTSDLRPFRETQDYAGRISQLKPIEVFKRYWNTLFRNARDLPDDWEERIKNKQMSREDMKEYAEANEAYSSFNGPWRSDKQDADSEESTNVDTNTNNGTDIGTDMSAGAPPTEAELKPEDDKDKEDVQSVNKDAGAATTGGDGYAGPIYGSDDKPNIVNGPSSSNLVDPQVGDSLASSAKVDTGQIPPGEMSDTTVANSADKTTGVKSMRDMIKKNKEASLASRGIPSGMSEAILKNAIRESTAKSSGKVDIPGMGHPMTDGNVVQNGYRIVTYNQNSDWPDMTPTKVHSKDGTKKKVQLEHPQRH